MATVGFTGFFISPIEPPIVDLLLQHGTDGLGDALTKFAIHKGAESCGYDTTKLLLDKVADIVTSSALSKAIASSCSIFSRVLRTWTAVNGDLAALHAACRCLGFPFRDTVEYRIRLSAKLLPLEADAIALDSSGNSVLHTSIRNIACAPQVGWGLTYALGLNGADFDALKSNGTSAPPLVETQRHSAAVIIPGLLRYAAVRLAMCVALSSSSLTPCSSQTATQPRNQGPARPGSSGSSTVAGHVKIVRLLCENDVCVGTFISDDENTAFFCPVRSNTVNIVSALLQHGSEPHHHGHFDRTALYHHATAQQRNDRRYSNTITAGIVELLITRDTNVNAKRGCHECQRTVLVLDIGSITRAQGRVCPHHKPRPELSV
ncbi:hypothetical protein FPHYL_6274 [Fusarium phyllophilum]|uniref:Ankyrin repeat protein n=1 Tax=Fusarium phyllophilum TaxID=47803 RepID=A0A8H5JT03_9HYPO|nr:hypothetical protein FPHYL_6274 [Fusarium phyllophilum]